MAATLLLLATTLLACCSAQRPNGPTGPFEPEWNEAQNADCKKDMTYCAPKAGNYPEPKRPPDWLKALLGAAPQSYAGAHNDLGKLLKLRARDRWVTLFQYTLGQRDFFLNALYTYLRFGQADFFIVATVTEGAFHDCVAMQLPCYNATPHYRYVAEHYLGNQVLGADGHHAHYNFGSALHMQLTWMNVHLGLAVLEHGYHFMHSDVDVAFMRRVLPSLGLLERLGGDVGMLPLTHHVPCVFRQLNPANLIARSTPGAITFFKAYLDLIQHGQNNEVAINMPRFNTSFTRCSTREQCASASAANVAALVELPSLYEGGGSCYSRTMGDGACDSRRLFVHVLCGVGRPWKMWALRNAGLWYLTDFSGNEVNASAGLGPVLPCAAPDDVAWHKPMANYSSLPPSEHC